MIHFRCWRCHRKYKKADAKIGQTFLCSCENLVRVPKHDHGNSRVKTLVDRLVEAIVCGGAGALFGFVLSFFLFARLFIGAPWLIPACTAIGGVFGFLGGEKAVDLMGEWIRRWERD